MNTKNVSKRRYIGVLLASVLAACDGGDGSSSSTPTDTHSRIATVVYDESFDNINDGIAEFELKQTYDDSGFLIKRHFIYTDESREEDGEIETIETFEYDDQGNIKTFKQESLELDDGQEYTFVSRSEYRYENNQLVQVENFHTPGNGLEEKRGRSAFEYSDENYLMRIQTFEFDLENPVEERIFTYGDNNLLQSSTLYSWFTGNSREKEYETNFTWRDDGQIEVLELLGSDDNAMPISARGDFSYSPTNRLEKQTWTNDSELNAVWDYAEFLESHTVTYEYNDQQEIVKLTSELLDMSGADTFLISREAGTCRDAYVFYDEFLLPYLITHDNAPYVSGTGFFNVCEL